NVAPKTSAVSSQHSLSLRTRKCSPDETTRGGSMNRPPKPLKDPACVTTRRVEEGFGSLAGSNHGLARSRSRTPAHEEPDFAPNAASAIGSGNASAAAIAPDRK